MNAQALHKFCRIGLGGILVAGIAALSAIAQEPVNRQLRLLEFQDLRIVPASGGHLIVPGKLPDLRWENPGLVLELFGKFPLEVRWFDAAGREVTEAKLPGRYGVYVEGRATDGRLIRRALPFYCADPALAAVAAEFPPRLADTPIFGLPEDVWNAHREEIDRFILDALAQRLQRDPEAAVLAAGMAEWDPQTPRILAAPSTRHQEYHLRLKRKILGVEEKYPPLERPRRLEVSAPMLVEGTPHAAGVSDDLPAKLDDLCRKWSEEAGEPLTALVARRGVIVFHQAYGERAGEAVTRDTAYPLFSLTKMLTGVMLAQFLDADLLDLDQPLGEVLPDLPTTGPNAITLRQCLMHVTGLDGHNRWGGPDNPWLDNVVANGLDAVRPTYRYSGVAYDLAGTAMQLVGGKSIPRLFHEQLFEPLGFEGARITDLGSGGQLRAIDLARVGQLLLNRGSYGEHQFFGPATFEQILPRSYEELFPGIAPTAADYGLGIYWAREVHPQAGQGELPKDAKIMSRRTLCHGAYSGTLFQVDLENELVVVVGRFNSGANHGDHVKALLMTVMEGLLK